MAHKNKLLLELLRNEPLNADTHLLTLALDAEEARSCLPGQFFNLRPLDSSAPLLRRPISICDVRPETGEADFLVRVLGDGTRLLTRKLPGDRVDVVGPLGTSFQTDPARPALMVAGGVGVAPLYFLARRLRREATASGKKPAAITFCYGARRQADFVLLDRLEAEADALVLTTEDGSRGEKGRVTVATERFLTPETQVFVCGPPRMMQALLEQMRAQNIEGQLSLENQMGCGVGACMGCVTPGRHGLIRVCCDGPVVSSELLDFVVAD